MSDKTKLPLIIDKTEEEINLIIEQINATSLSTDLKSFIISCIRSVVWIPNVLRNKNISIRKLKDMIFGPSRKPKKNKPSKDNTAPPESGNTSPENASDDDEKTNKNNNKSNKPNSDNKESGNKKPGHGRMSHDVYQNCAEITFTIDNVKVGDPCPKDCSGWLGASEPGVFVRIKGQNFAEVTRYTVTKFRCNLCGVLVIADIPPEVGEDKYLPSFKSMLALQKFYVGVPYYRQENFQKLLGFPLPDSTQWDLIEQLAGACYAPFNELKQLAANGSVIHNDDTWLRILDVMKANQNAEKGERTGMFTTGILALYGEHKIALFLNGEQHAGENLEEILSKRTQKEKIIQMSDALSLNIPKSIETILCNCLSHGFRKFKDLVDFFEPECITIMQLLGDVFDIDEKTKSMDVHARLNYHQKYSAPIMEKLKNYMAELIDKHLVEPNSALGKAIYYMQKHWPELTKFLSVAGAPIDNNIVERALKIAIRVRKVSYFYRTSYSANISGMITSLIYTCHLADTNAFDYLTALQEYKDYVTKAPKNWLPWNFEKTLIEIKQENTIKDDASPQGRSPPMEHLAAI